MAATALGGRAAKRLQDAIQAIVAPEVGRLMEGCERLAKELAEGRQALKFAGSLTDPYGEERRAVDRYLSQDWTALFPLEFGLKAEPSAAWAAWAEFADAIKNDAETVFPA